jgi:hypothetical protein
MPLPPTTPAEYSSFTSRLGPDCRDNPDRSTNINQTKLPKLPCKNKKGEPQFLQLLRKEIPKMTNIIYWNDILLMKVTMKKEFETFP